MASERVTLIVIHSAQKPPKTISVSRKVFYAAGLALVLLLAFSVITTVRLVSVTVDKARLHNLRFENQMLRAEIEDLTQKVASLEKEMEKHVAFEERLRVLADLEPMDKDVWEVGVGGPELVRPAQALPPYGKRLTSLNEEVDRLLRQIRLQRDSFNQILDELRKKTNELRFIPSIRPVDGGFISSRFGRRRDPFTGRMSRHEGVDFSTRRGAKVYATADGVVTMAKYDGGYGLTVEIDHGNGIVTRYAHNAKLLVRKGQRVKRGDVIAYVGNSGRSTAPHLHYEVRVNGVPRDPLKFILPSDVIVD